MLVSGEFMMFCRMSVVCVVVALCVWDADVATAQNSADPESAVAVGPCEGQTAARVEFLEERLEGDRKWARNWTYGFRSFYGLGTVVTAAQAIDEDDSGDRAADIVSSVKAAFGTARLFWAPPNARLGASVMNEVPLDSADSCQRRLEAGEAALRKNAKEANSRFSWKRHASIVGINVLGASVADGFYDSGSDAWVSAGVGVVVGEIMTYLHPSRAADDLPEYERSYLAEQVSRYDLRVAPQGMGIRLSGSF
jgi:hypothetical protein